jgi:hypothetical protein
LEALANNNIPTQGVKIASNYQPQMVSDCIKVAGTGTIPAATVNLYKLCIYKR